MTRPMLTVGFTYLVGLILTAFALPGFGYLIPSLLLAVLIITVTALSLIRKRFTHITLAVICLTVAFLQYSFIYADNIAPGQGLDGKTPEVTAVVKEVSFSGGYAFCSCHTETVDGKPSGNIGFTYWDSDNPTVKAGDRISAIISFKADSPLYSADSLNKYSAQGLFLEGEAESDVILISESESSFTLRGLSLSLRDIFSTRMRRNLPLNGGDMADALVFGKTNSLSSDVTENFRLSGTNHILSVSGYHLTVLSAFILTVTELLGLGKKSRSAVTIVFILLYMIMVGFPYSLVRAGIMAITVCLSQLTGRESDKFSALSLAVLIICIFNPLAIWDAGFLMSLGSMLGIFIFHDRLHEFCSVHIYESRLPVVIRSLLKLLIPSVTVGLGATVGVFPLIAAVSGSFNLCSALTSALLSVPSGIVLGGGILVAVIGDMGASRLIGIPVSIAADIMKDITAFFADKGFSALPFSAWIFVLYFILAVTLFLISPKRPSRRKIIASVLCCIAVFAAMFISDHERLKDMEGIYVNVQDNTTGLVIVHDGKAFTLSTGRTTHYGTRAFVRDMGLDNVGLKHISDFKTKEDIDLFGDGQVILHVRKAEIYITAFGRSIALNTDGRVSGEYDILLQELSEDNYGFIPAKTSELTLICDSTDSDTNELIKLMPAGSNLTVRPGEGILIELGDEMNFTKINY